MLKCTFKLVGQSPIGFSKVIMSKKETGETHEAFEERTWRERLHCDEKMECFIPPMALKNCLTETAKFLSESVPGKGKATFTKHFRAGLMVTDPLMLGVKRDDVPPLRLFVPSDGKTGGGSRVFKNFPVIQTWSARGSVYVLDPTLTSKPEKIQEYLGHAGKFVGLGFSRPANGGYFGRFIVEDFKAIEEV